jgi:hypothetical protein
MKIDSQSNLFLHEFIEISIVLKRKKNCKLFFNIILMKIFTTLLALSLLLSAQAVFENT